MDEAALDVPGGRIVKIRVENGLYVCVPPVEPPNPWRKDRRFARENLTVEADPERDAARRRARIGPFCTQSIAEDTPAYRQGVLDLKEFLRQSMVVREDEMKLLRNSLDHFREGLLFFRFSNRPGIAHAVGEVRGGVMEVYRAVDAAVGKAARQFPRADIIVMPDHGFKLVRPQRQPEIWLWEKTISGNARTFAGRIAGREKNAILRAGTETGAVTRRLARELAEFRRSG